MRLVTWKRMGAVLLLLCLAWAQVPPIRNIKSDLLGIVNSPAELQTALISPDGDSIAWARAGALCLLTAQGAACQPTPEGFTASRLVWSPDSLHIALDGNGVLVYDVVGAAFPLWIDRPGWVVGWDAAGLLLLEDSGTLTRWIDDSPTPLATLPPAAGEVTAAALHPDETHLTWANDAGLWLLDLATGDTRQLATHADLQAGAPGWAGVFQAVQLWWAGENLVVLAANTDPTAPFSHLLHHIDISAGAVTPLVDLSSLADEAALMRRDEAGNIAAFRIPRAGVLAPDGSAFIYLHFFTQDNDFAAWSRLPLDGGAVVELGRITDFDAAFPPFLASRSAQGHMLLYGYIVE